MLLPRLFRRVFHKMMVDVGTQIASRFSIDEHVARHASQCE